MRTEVSAEWFFASVLLAASLVACGRESKPSDPGTTPPSRDAQSSQSNAGSSQAFLKHASAAASSSSALSRSFSEGMNLVDSDVAVAHGPSRPLLVQFTGDYCLACHVMEPDLMEVRKRYRGELDVAVVNIDRPEFEKLAKYFVIEAVPSQRYVDAAGKIVYAHTGIESQQGLINRFKQLGWVK